MGRGLVLALVVAASSAFVTCGGSSERHREGGRGGSPGGGATATGGNSLGGSAGTAGSAPSGGTVGDLAGSSGGGGDANGGTATGGASADGGASSGGEGGGGDCIDVCALHGPACCIPNVECVSSDAHCVLEVLAAEVAIIYDYPTLEQRIAALPQDVLASIPLADVNQAAAEPLPAARIELHSTDEAAAAHHASLAGPLVHPFRVSCNGQALFVGVTYIVHGAAAIQTPVLHVDSTEESPLILRIGAQQGAWAGVGVVGTEARQRIDRPELRAALCRQGVLDVLQ